MTTAHTPEDTEQYRLIRAGDVSARNKMAERHMGLVQKVATYYAKRNPLLDMDDLLQEGRIGVIIALSKFDVDSGYRFATYGTYWIKHYIQRYVVSNHSRAASTSKKDTEAYIAERMSPEDAALYELRCISHHSIDYQNGDGRIAGEHFADDEQPIEESAEIALRWYAVREMLWHPKISPNQRVVICMRYGILGYTPHRLAEIAEKLSVTRQAVSAAEQRALAILRELMTE